MNFLKQKLTEARVLLMEIYALFYAAVTRRHIQITALMSWGELPPYTASYRVRLESPNLNLTHRAARLIPSENDKFVAAEAFLVAEDYVAANKLPPTATFVKVGNKKIAEIVRKEEDE